MRSQTTRQPAKADKNQKLRVKNEPPTMEEAMLAASGMSDEPSQQLELAAMLLGIPLDAATTKALNAAKPRGNVVDISSRGGASRTVVVEKKRVVRAPTMAPGTPQVAPVAPRAFAGKLRLGGRI
jgi:hypothetical protein